MPRSTAAPIKFSPDAAIALKSLAQTDDGKFILDWVVKAVCQTYEESFHPDNQYATAYALGRRSVGRTIVQHINSDLSKLKET